MNTNIHQQLLDELDFRDDNPPQDVEERQNILNPCQSFIISAPAGSGKTTLLIIRMLVCLLTCEKPEEVYFLTFTNMAINEAETRFISALQLGTQASPPESTHDRVIWALAKKVLQRDREKNWQLLHNPARLRIMTIDQLNAMLASQLPILSGFGGPSQVEDHPHYIYKQAIVNLFAELEDNDIDETFQQALLSLTRYANNRIETIEPMLLSLLMTRDQWLGSLHDLNDDNVNSVLLQILTDRLEAAYDLTGDYLIRLLAILKMSPHALHAEFDDYPALPASDNINNITLWRALAQTLLTKEGGLRKTVNKNQGFEPKTDETNAMKTLLSELQGHPALLTIEQSLNEILMLPDPHYPASLHEFKTAIAIVLKRLVAHLKLAFEGVGKVDFIEVAFRALAALGSETEVNNTLLKLDYVIRHLLIDEFQDTNLSQYRLLLKLTSGWTLDDGRTLTAVGDSQQSIYRFRQADVSLFIQLWATRQFGDISLERVQLTTNFRSERPIVDWFNRNLEQIFPKKANLYDAAVPFSPSTAIVPARTGLGVNITCFPSIRSSISEAEFLVEQIKTAKQARPNDSIAVLVRSRKHLLALIHELKQHNISFMSQDIDPISEKSATNDVIHLIRAMWHAHDRTAWVGVLRAPFVGLSWADCTALLKGHPHDSILTVVRQAKQCTALSPEGCERITRLITAYDAVMADPQLVTSLRRSTESLWHLLGGPACITQAEYTDILNLLDLLDRHCTAGQLTNAEEFLNATTELYASPENGEVSLMTIHKAKGLEFDTVILPALHKLPRPDDPPLLHHRHFPGGYFLSPNVKHHSVADPQSEQLYNYMGYLEKNAKLQEAYRLLYVAITRAKKHLILTAHVKIKDGEAQPPAATSFLGMLWPTIQDDYTIAATQDEHAIQFAPTLTPPLSPRLDLAWTYPTIESHFTPRIDIATLPSEMVIRQKGETKANKGETVVNRLVGIMYHALIERVANEGLRNWTTDKITAQRTALMSGCRRLGMPEPNVDAATDYIISLAQKTLNDPIGQWILADHTHAKNEFSLTGYVHHEWVSVVLDRTFTEDKTRWIIDYKTGGGDLASHEVDAFIESSVLAYTPQLQRYSDIYAQYDPSSQAIRRLIYFPALGVKAEV